MATTKSKATQAPSKRGEYMVYLLDFENRVIATLAEQVTQQEAKRIAVETDCDVEQMIVISHGDWNFADGDVETFSQIAIRKTTA